MKLYCFDVDGTLIQSFIRDHPQKHGSDLEADVYDRVELLPGRRLKLASLANEGVSFAIVTNQAGVAFGYQTEEQVRAKMAKCLAALNFFFGRPFSVHIAFTHPNPHEGFEQYRREQTPYARRKPGYGMLEEARIMHRMSSRDMVFVGDMDSDREAAGKLGITYYDAEEFFNARA